MSSPHPGVVHFEWADAGIQTVVNTTAERGADFFEAFGLPLVPAAPSIPGLVAAIGAAVERATGRQGAKRACQRRKLCRSWDEAFSPAFLQSVIDTCKLPAASVRRR